MTKVKKFSLKHLVQNWLIHSIFSFQLKYTKTCVLQNMKNDSSLEKAVGF